MNKTTQTQQVETKRVNDTEELARAIETARIECKAPYAQAYLQAIPEASVLYGKEGLGVQLLYCLNNMGTWRGETARQTKKVFKKWAKLLN